MATGLQLLLLEDNGRSSPSGGCARAVAQRTRTRAGVQAALAKVEWDFVRDAETALHSIHPYPAKFISAIPRALIEAIGVSPGTGVLDPFCGAGTTLAVAREYGIPSVGIDLNPIACLLSRVKTQPTPNDFVPLSVRIAAKVQSRPHSYAVPALPNLDHWFEEPVCRALAGLTSEIAAASVDENTRDHLRAALSSIIVRVSNQESDTRYAAVGKRVTFDSVIANFVAASARVQSAKESLDYGQRTEAFVVERDVLQVSSADVPLPISLAITSPPYPNAYEYWLYHKYRMWWLGFDPIGVKEREIGARAHYFKKDHATYEQFVEQMRATLKLLHEVMIGGAYFAVVVGRSRIHGVEFKTGDTFAELGSSTGFDLIFRTTRTIAATRKSFNLSHARITDEDLLVFERI